MPSRALTLAGSRRRAITGLLSATLGLALGTPETENVAAKKKKCPPCKERKQGKCKKVPDGTACSGGTCQNGSCCVPNCSGKDCGPDGCGGMCGPCTGGTCSPTGDCDCGSGKELCRGACIATCTDSQMRRPGTCYPCCYVNGTARDVGLSTCVITCCSGTCTPNPSGPGFICTGRELCDPCDFNEQCADGLTCQNRRCVEPGEFCLDPG